MIPAPLLPPVAVLLIAVNVAMWIASVERREAGERRIPQVVHWSELE
jgi:hypothetical protein